MQNFGTNVNKVRQIAWTLAKASALDCLDVPGEYIWAFPKSNSFYSVRDRHRSIFSSGNSIKDPDIIDYIRNINLSKFLTDPWIVESFEQNFISWVKDGSGNTYSLKNIELFKYSGISAGSQESFLNFYIMNKNKRLRIFRGDYWWHMEVWSKLNLQWAYIEDDDLRPQDVCICSYPFALTGDKHPQFDWLLDECNRKNIELLLDFIYLPNSNNCVDVDLSAPCIKEITFSLSKTFPVQCAKIAVRMLKKKPNDPMQISNDENISNRLSAGLGYSLIQKFPISYIFYKYKDKQEHWCNALGLQKTKVVHMAIGDDYTTFGRTNITPWYSTFNQQQNRYNLGMLYENENLLKKIGLY